jgi:hypothetical protein
MKTNARLAGCLALGLLSSAACGGGSGPSGPILPPAGQQNQLPTADAGVPTNADASGWTSVGSNDAGAIAPNAADYGRLSIAGGVPYAIFHDYSHSSKLTVMKLSGGKWTNVGTAGFTGESSYNYTLYMDGTTPYVAYVGSSAYGLNVMKFDGTNWVSVGSANFATSNYSTTPSLAVVSGTVYIGFTDSDGMLHVMSFTGSVWLDLGGVAVSTSYSYYFAMTIFNNTVYVAYNDETTYPSVMKLAMWTGAVWSVVATSTYTIDEYCDPVLTVSNNTLYLIYYTYGSDPTTGNTCGPIVYQLSGNTLVSVGKLCSISAGDYVEYVSGVVYNGVPYVAFDDEERDSDPEPRAAVVKYFDATTSTWQLLAGYPSPSDIENTFLVVDPSSGKLYLTYEDWSAGGMIVQVH